MLLSLLLSHKPTSFRTTSLRCWPWLGTSDIEVLQVQGPGDGWAPVLHAGDHVLNGVPVQPAEEAASALRHAVWAARPERSLRLVFSG